MVNEIILRKSIEEKAEFAKLDLNRAQSVLSKNEALLKKFGDLELKFNRLITKSDLDIKFENNPEFYMKNGNSYNERYRLLAKQDSVLDTLYDLALQDHVYYPDAHSTLKNKLRDNISYYIKGIWDRSITEHEYSSIVDATESFLGKYVQRVYDRRKEAEAELNRLVEKEERSYSKDHYTPSLPPKVKEESNEKSVSLSKFSMLLRYFSRS